MQDPTAGMACSLGLPTCSEFGFQFPGCNNFFRLHLLPTNVPGSRSYLGPQDLNSKKVAAQGHKENVKGERNLQFENRVKATVALSVPQRCKNPKRPSTGRLLLVLRPDFHPDRISYLKSAACGNATSATNSSLYRAARCAKTKNKPDLA